MNNTIILHQAYTHYKNGLTYTPVDFCKIQENDVWVKAVIYETESKELFVRSEEEFKAKFTKK